MQLGPIDMYTLKLNGTAAEQAKRTEQTTSKVRVAATAFWTHHSVQEPDSDKHEVVA